MDSDVGPNMASGAAHVTADLNPNRVTQQHCKVSLCNDCSKLNLRRPMQWLAEQAVLDRKFPGGWPTCVARMGSKYRARPTNECPLCIMLFDSRVSVHQSSKEDCLYIHPLHAVESRLHAEGFNGGPRHTVVAGLAIVPELFTVKKEVFYGTEIDHQIRASGFPIVQMAEQRLSYAATSMPKKTLMAYDEIKECLRRCSRSHASCHKNLLSQQPMPLLLVDCWNRAIQTNLFTDEKYVALSYVWGQVPIHRADEGHLPLVLPRTIHDAIELTQALGYRYLWVDQFCIDQDNVAVKHEQIKSMGRIYDGAELTIVAACGEDASHGLPGVARHPRRTTSSFLLDDCIVQSYRKNTSAAVEYSRWNCRGWTFQEAYLSRRLLFVGEDQYVFQCRGGLHAEGNPGTWDKEVMKGQIIPNGTFRFDTAPVPDYSMGRHRINGSFWMNYATMVRKYWARNLRFDTDAVLACIAGLEYLKVQWEKGLWKASPSDRSSLAFVHGLPTIVPQSKGSRHRSQELQMWADCLLFHFDLVEVRRRKCFPSWSWAGYAALNHQYTTKSSFQIPYSYTRGQFEPVIEDVPLASSSRKHTNNSDDAPSAHRMVEEPESLEAADVLSLKAYAVPPELFSLNGDNSTLTAGGRESPARMDFGVLTSEFFIDCSVRRLPVEVFWKKVACGDFDIVIISARGHPGYRDPSEGRWLSEPNWKAQCLILERLDEEYHQRVGYAVVGGRLPRDDMRATSSKQAFEESCVLRNWQLK
ncbi:HET-domain-containing protein [Apiospora hydei]|uniref:HET-domain-containing protein n=1 Tax=Apiospora hydei TaxID=1337664 RepID=A0ABR1XA14_9PEZI